MYDITSHTSRCAQPRALWLISRKDGMPLQVADDVDTLISALWIALEI
jgi:hypothetical protein